MSEVPYEASTKQQALEVQRSIARDLMAGLPALLAKKETYLPREPMELPVTLSNGVEIDPYENRCKRARLANLFRDGILSLVDRAFGKKVKLTKETPLVIAGDAKRGLKGFQDDVDLKGTNLHVFLRRRCRTSAAEGVDFVLVDYPESGADGTQSVEEVKRSGLRPYWRTYSPANVLDWHFESIGGGAPRLVYLLLRDWESRDGKRYEVRREFLAGDPKTGVFAQWRVLKKATDTTSQKPEWIVLREGFRRPHFDIPFVPIPTDADEPFDAEPPMIDAAHLTLAHFRKSSDLDNAQHAVGFPIFYVSGVSINEFQEQIKAAGHSSSRFYVLPQPGGQAGFAEPSGSSWAHLETSLDKIEKQVSSIMAEPERRQTAAPLTATGEAKEDVKHVSQLEAWVQQWKDAANLLLYYTAIDYGEVKPGADRGWGGVEITLNLASPAANVDTSRHAHELVDLGVQSRRSAFRVSQGAGAIPDDTTFEDEQRAIEEEGAGSASEIPPDDGDDLTKQKRTDQTPKPEPGAVDESGEGREAA